MHDNSILAASDHMHEEDNSKSTPEKFSALNIYYLNLFFLNYFCVALGAITFLSFAILWHIMVKAAWIKL